MKIVLDTKEETLQDLKDTVRMLQALIESRGGAVNTHSRDLFASTASGDQAAVTGLMSMFDNVGTTGSAPQLDEGRNDPDRLISDIKIVEY